MDTGFSPKLSLLKFNEYFNTVIEAFVQHLQRNCIIRKWTGETVPLQAGRSGGCPAKLKKPALVRGLFRLCGEHGGYFSAANSFAKLHGDRAVTTKAKGSNVIEVALAAPFCNGQNMIGIP